MTALPPMLVHVFIAIAVLAAAWALTRVVKKDGQPGPALWAATAYALWAWLATGLTWRDLGLTWPEAWPWWVLPLAALGAMLAAYAALTPVYLILVKRLKWPPPDMSRFEGRFKGRPGFFALIMAYNWTSAAFVEELFFRAFLISALTLTFGAEPLTLVSIVLAQAVLFGLPHAYQGKTGIVQSGIIGLVFGAGFVALGTLWPFVLAHGLIGTVGLTALYARANGRTKAA